MFLNTKRKSNCPQKGACVFLNRKCVFSIYFFVRIQHTQLFTKTFDFLSTPAYISGKTFSVLRKPTLRGELPHEEWFYFQITILWTANDRIFFLVNTNKTKKTASHSQKSPTIGESDLPFFI